MRVQCFGAAPFLLLELGLGRIQIPGMKLSRLTILDVAALLGAATPEVLEKVEASAGFSAGFDELHQANQAMLEAEQRLERAERAIAVMAREFFKKSEIKDAKWEK